MTKLKEQQKERQSLIHITFEYLNQKSWITEDKYGFYTRYTTLTGDAEDGPFKSIQEAVHNLKVIHTIYE